MVSIFFYVKKIFLIFSIKTGSNLRLEPKDSPSPRNKYATHPPKLPNSSIVNLTVDTHYKIWQIVEDEPDINPLKKSPGRRRIHSLDDALKSLDNKNVIVEYYAATDDEGFVSNDNSNNSHTDRKKKLLFSSHAQFSKEINLDDGVEENILLSDLDPNKLETRSEGKLPSVTNEVYVRICGNGNKKINDQNIDDENKENT